ncbi:citrate lyase holo-[acyl-carrier protein] synthase [Atopobacter phocae]|uniref:citrate lyase holo-[acyl-carrier protein] synthase n=1 Tax=Atopobacter phocae TaxID=136492 RepID=UPI000472D065|nr:citrate lyase holo-[acyl-carrier protein] synthase [Atopobacter phocae]
MDNLSVTLEEMLDQRERRAYWIQQMVEHHPEHTVISFKLNIPGPEKNNDLYLFAFEEGLKQISAAQIQIDWRHLKTGPEAILTYPKDIQMTKKDMVAIEEHFALGRLYDLDVVGANRQTLNLAPRQCLICQRPAHECSRNRTHQVHEIVEQINHLIMAYRTT